MDTKSNKQHHTYNANSIFHRITLASAFKALWITWESEWEHKRVCKVTTALASAMTTPMKSNFNHLYYLRYVLVTDALIFLTYFRKIEMQLKEQAQY